MTGPKTKRKNPRKNRKKGGFSASSSSEDEEWFSSGESTEDDEGTEDQDEQQLASGPWTYDLDEMRVKNEFEITDIYREMNASDFTVEYVQENGLEEPLLFRDSVSSLGMKMPKDGTFTVPCVLKAVGDRQIEVVDVMTQGSRHMMLSDFVQYYESPPAEREELLNVLSLEYSLTPLAKRVRAPALAREIDWVELYWPEELRNSPSTFPKVQNYCLMSVKGSFTDFHIDFGGTSVWYHVYRGRKTFWVVEPTEENILKYEQWILEGTQHEAFFGDIVDKCARIELYEGYTFIIPSGWIHAVYTPEDSLVFGGNFLHSFSIPMQIRVTHSEDTLMIKKKYRYPKHMEMVWYVVESIVKKATGRDYEINTTEKTSKISTVDEETDSKTEVRKEENGDNARTNEDNATEDPVKNDIEEYTNEVTCKKEFPLPRIEADVTDSTAAQIKDEETPTVKEERVGDTCSGEDKLVSNAEEKDLVFDDEYLATISKRERDGYKVLLGYMRDSVKGHSDSESQKMRNLLDVFEQVLDHQVPQQFIIEREKKKRMEAQAAPKLNQWLAAFGNSKTPQTKRKIPPKEQAAETQQISRPKPPKSRTKSSKRPDHHKPDGPLIVGGIPPAIMPPDAPQAPNPYGYDPLASVTPLGHKQLPSAYRRTPDMAKAPPSQKFRLQPHKAVVATSEKTEAMLEKTPEKPSPAGSSSVPGPSNVDKVEENEKKNAAAAPSGNEKAFHHGESWRFRRDREKDNQRDNRHIVKEEYPELQYRSPLARPGPSNNGINTASKPGYGSYRHDRYSNKTFKRRFTDSDSFAERRSVGSRDARRASDIDSRKKEYSTSWRPEPYRRFSSTDQPGSSSRPFVHAWPQEAPAVVRHTYTVPGDPRLPSTEGLSKLSYAEKDKIHLNMRPEGATEGLNVSTTTTSTAQQGGWKSLSPVARTGSSQYVPLLSREQKQIPAAVSNFDAYTQHICVGSESSILASPVSLPIKRPPSLSEPVRSAAIQPVKPAEEAKKPEIRELSVTLNEDNEDGAGIMAAAEELAKLTKVFDVDERVDSEKKKLEPTKVGSDQRNPKRQNSSSLEKKNDNERLKSPSEERNEAETVPPPTKLPRIPTETILQDLSSLTAEFNAVED